MFSNAFIKLLLSLSLSINCCESSVTQNPYQWGHYENYDPRNRPLESYNPNDRQNYGTRYGVTPDPNRRRLIEDPGDLRCKEALHQGLY